MRQRTWLKLIKVYNCTINYYLRKANVVADALGRKDRLNMISVTAELYKEFKKLEFEVRNSDAIHGMLCKIMFQPEH